MSKRREKRKKQKKAQDLLRMRNAAKRKPEPGLKTKAEFVKETEEMRKAGKIVNCVLCGRDLAVPEWVRSANTGDGKTNTMVLNCRCGGKVNVKF